MATITDLLRLGDTDVLDSMNTEAFVYRVLSNDTNLTVTEAMSLAGTLLLLLNVASSTYFLEATFQQRLLALIQQVEAGAHPKHVHIVDTLQKMFRGFLKFHSTAVTGTTAPSNDNDHRSCSYSFHRCGHSHDYCEPPSQDVLNTRGAIFGLCNPHT